MAYLLQYAGVPFVGDDGRSFSNGDPSLDFQQPLERLYAELERRIPSTYLHDFQQPTGTQQAGVVLPWDDSTPPTPQLQLGDWYYPWGASRYSVFRGWMTSSQYKAALAATGGSNPATFTMTADSSLPAYPNAQGSVSTAMYMLPGRPLAEHGGAFDGVYLITLVDGRYYFAGNRADLKVTQDTTWDDLIFRLGLAIGATISYSAIESVYGRPEPDSPLWAKSCPAEHLIDLVAYNLGRTFVRSLDGSYSLLTYAESKAVVLANRGNAKKIVRYAGGDLFSSGNVSKAGDLNPAKNSVLPSSVVVAFPKYAMTPVPHFVNDRYQNQRPSAWVEDNVGSYHEVTVPSSAYASGLTGTSTYTIRALAKAVYSGEDSSSANNATGLEALATKIAQDYAASLVTEALDEVYPGVLAWTPEGLHDVVWTYSARREKACTRVVCRAWTDGNAQSQHATPVTSGQTVNLIGVGGRSVAQTWRDSYGDEVTATLLGSGPGPIMSGDSYFILNTAGGFPTQNRWRAKIDGEIVLMEGTSGGVLRSLSGDYVVNVAYRAIDGTVPAQHGSGSTLTQVVPNTTYGANLVTLDKMTFCHPMTWSSGGIQEVKLVAQTQTVTATAGSGGGIQQGAAYLFPALVNPYQAGDGQFTTQEAAYIVERSSGIVFSGRRYDGQFVGYSYTSTPAPIYAVNGTVYASGLSGTVDVVSNVCDDLFEVRPGVNIAFDYSTPGGVTINSTVNGSGAIYSGDSSITLTAASAWGLILCYSESTMVFTLPDPASLTDDVTYTFKKTGPTGQAVQINSTAFIDGATSYSMSTQWDYVTIRPQAGRYYVVGNGF